MASAKTPNFSKALPLVLVVGSVVGIICSLVLTYDQIRIWQNPSYQPACSLNPVVSCGSVIDSKQGHIFNIPAPFFGLMMFPALLTVGVAMFAGAKFKRWFWLVLEGGVIGGFIFVMWLLLLSLYRIHALCPFCLVTDVVVYSIVWYLTLYSIESNVIRLPTGMERTRLFIRRHHLDILILWLLLLVTFILQHFWYYFGKHL